MATIKLTEKEWLSISEKIKQNHGRTVLLIRSVMQRELGFVTRNHRYWQTDPNSTGSGLGYGEYITEIHLDFYDSAKETLFRLKYL